MTPQRKANELINDFWQQITYKLGEDTSKQRAIKCSLICVEEVLGYMGADRGVEFWNEVKIELENTPTN